MADTFIIQTSDGSTLTFNDVGTGPMGPASNVPPADDLTTNDPAIPLAASQGVVLANRTEWQEESW